MALRGERFDAHAFLRRGAGPGAAGAVVVTPGVVPDAARRCPASRSTTRCAALGASARGPPAPLRLRRSSASPAPNGKTTTKEMIAASLAPLGPVLKTEGNLNNEMGVPLTLLRLGA